MCASYQDNPPKSLTRIVYMLMVMLILVGCSNPFSLGGPTATSGPPTSTPEPMAIMVNSEGISETEYEAELVRFQSAQAALGNSVTQEEAAQRVSDDLIDQLLLAQGAAEAGFVVDDEALQSRIDDLASQAGGAVALDNWINAHAYTQETFRQALRRQIVAAWMRDQIIATVPTSAEQVHVMQILLYNEGEAQNVLAQLQAGADFATLAKERDPYTHGDLGWLPRGYLPEQQIETAIFALQPGQYSHVVATQVGYHIFMVMERDSEHLLSPDSLLTLQRQALVDWLSQRRAQSTITLAP